MTDTRMPVAWHFTYWGTQLVSLFLVGVLLTIALQTGALYDLVFSVLPDATVLIPFPHPLSIAVPLWLPLLLGLPLVLTPYRTPLLVWMGLIVLFLVAGLIELYRMPWVALSGVNFYFAPDHTLNSGAVPFLRTLFSALTLLAVVAVLAHQSIHLHVDDLLSRGVPLKDVHTVRTRLLVLERGLLLAAAGGAFLLTVVVGISMETINAKNAGEAEAFAPFLFAAATVGVMLVGLGVGVMRKRGVRPT
ncbi:MAG: hypothetical protein KY455_04390 [Euryarchaeota archaeon]|nr:hypothetical protein [Euryarchaeota archaeon]